MCRPRTARAITVGGTILAVAGGLVSWGGSSAVATGVVRSTVVTLAGGTTGTGHAEMSPTSMPGMDMSAAADPGQGAYLTQTPHGSARLRQTGDLLTGMVTVSGLPPGSHHAEGLLGAAAGCSAASERSAAVAIALPVLVANATGVAHSAVSLTVAHHVIVPGYVLMVDRDPTVGEIDGVGSVTSSQGLPRTFTADPAVLCGSVRAT